MLGERLKRFRVACGMSLANLATVLDSKVSSTTLSKYEKGRAQPTAKLLNRIAVLYGIKPSQLWSEPPCQVQYIHDQTGELLGKRERERIEAIAAEVVEKHVWFQELMSLKDTFKLPVSGFTVKNFEDAEEAANTLRDMWNLGIEPIHNLIDLLSDHGVHIIEVEASENFCGISCLGYNRKNHITVLIAIREGIEAYLQRHHILHELGHIILDIRNDLDTHEAIHRFSSAFLAHADQFRKDIGVKRKTVEIDEILHLKTKYCMGIQTVFYRLKDLEIITETHRQEWYEHFKIRDWLKPEPIFIPPEESKKLVQHVGNAWSEGLITNIDYEWFFNITGWISLNTTVSERREFLSLPKEKRNRILNQQEKKMEEFYENESA